MSTQLRVTPCEHTTGFCVDTRKVQYGTIRAITSTGVFVIRPCPCRTCEQREADHDSAIIENIYRDCFPEEFVR